ncbi:MAG: hypothetical protein V7606_2828 [Burkholderiales bacterium]|jgi:hypothetical protein
MKKMKAKLAALLAGSLLAFSSHSFAAAPMELSETNLNAEEPMQLSMDEMDKATAAGVYIFAPNVSIFYNYGVLLAGNIQGQGGTSNLIVVVKGLLRL